MSGPRMRRSIIAGALALPLAFLAMSGHGLAAPCQQGIASAPYIGAADMRAIDRAAAMLPKAAGSGKLDVGSAVPPSVKRAPVPGPVAKVLPQYRGYAAFTAGRELMIVDARGTLAYMMPLHGSANPANCP